LTAKQLVPGDAVFFIARMRDSAKKTEAGAEETVNVLIIIGHQFVNRAEQAVAQSLLS
jgi:hypothetical protein